jgi:hypothetical protein
VFTERDEAEEQARTTLDRIPVLGSLDDEGRLKLASRRAPFNPKLSGSGVVQRVGRTALGIARVGMSAVVLPVRGHEDAPRSAVVCHSSASSTEAPHPDQLLGWVPSVRIDPLYAMAVRAGLGQPTEVKSWSHAVRSAQDWCALLRSLAKGSLGDERHRFVASVAQERLEAGFAAARRADHKQLKTLEKQGRSQRRDLDFLEKHQDLLRRRRS